MNIHKRFAIQFFIQLILVSVLFFFIQLAVWAVIGFTIMSDEVNQDLFEADSYFFSERITIHDDEQIIFDKELKQLAKKQNGWFAVIKANGEVMGEYNTSGNIPVQFSESELASIMLKDRSNPVEYAHWKLEIESKQPLILLFGRVNTELLLLNQIKSNIDWTNQQLNLSSAMIQQMEKDHTWVQLINSSGQVEDEYGEVKQSKSYSVERLLALSAEESESVVSFFDDKTNQTIIVGKHPSNSTTNLEEGLFKTLSNRILIILVTLLILLLLGTFWYARKFGVPLIMMVKWIQNLGVG